jgi:uncharacterized protein YqeY
MEFIMSIERELATRLESALRSKDKAVLDVLRMVKSRAGILKTVPGFQEETDDAFYLDVITGYVKQQKKALVEFEKAGEKGRENAEKLRFEIDYLAPFLPAVKGEAEVRDIVKKAIADTGAEGAKMTGKVMGVIMKDHKDEVDASMVKRIVAEELG